ncbi:MAG TPA: hypothetical protein VEQ85_13975, partial [Lacipirellulaceae bacterium]|nr:hypothetical protein [Lacipirellulaceae bacterium]
LGRRTPNQPRLAPVLGSARRWSFPLAAPGVAWPLTVAFPHDALGACPGVMTLYPSTELPTPRSFGAAWLPGGSSRPAGSAHCDCVRIAHVGAPE